MKVRSEFHGYFLRALLPSTAIASNGSQQEDKSGDDSNNKVSFSTIIRRLGQCITVIVMVQATLGVYLNTSIDTSAQHEPNKISGLVITMGKALVPEQNGNTLNYKHELHTTERQVQRLHTRNPSKCAPHDWIGPSDVDSHAYLNYWEFPKCRGCKLNICYVNFPKSRGGGPSPPLNAALPLKCSI